MPNNESRRYWAHSNAKHWTCNVWSGLTRGWVLLWAHRTLDYRCLSTFLEIQQGRMINGINYINNLKCIKMSSVAFYWISSFIVLVSWKKIQNHFICFFHYSGTQILFFVPMRSQMPLCQFSYGGNFSSSLLPCLWKSFIDLESAFKIHLYACAWITWQELHLLSHCYALGPLHSSLYWIFRTIL